MIRNAEQIDTFGYDYETYMTPVRGHAEDVDISFVIPVFNEEDTVRTLRDEIERKPKQPGSRGVGIFSL